MIDPKMFDDLARRLAESVPTGVKQLQADFEKNARATLQAAFARMDLVTREEFDVQQSVLARTRQRLEVLEQQVAVLEARMLAKTKPSENADGD